MPDERRRGALTRRRLLFLAGGSVAAAAGVEALAGCGSTEPSGKTSLAAEDVNAPQLRNYPYFASQSPALCSLLSFFQREEALAVEAFTARLLPGDETDPGARELCVTHYIDRKLAQYSTFATPTYFKAPFAKPAKGHAPGRDGDTIYVDEKDLPLYGFQSSLTPQDSYRKGLKALDAAAVALYGKPFPDLSEQEQDAIVAGMEATDPSAKPGDYPPEAVMEGKRLKAFFAPPAPNAFGFFSMLQDDTSEGVFADPIYGGNRDYGGWKLIGYPGAQRSYTAAELKHGPQQRTIQGLRDMPAMHPGHPQPHTILPLAGSTRKQG
jgi:gluconate 2-dehydrogenase gamma chain